MTTQTYSGATLKVANSLPATNDSTGFAALTFIEGDCALHEVPSVKRTWDKVTEELVCNNTSYDVKGGAKWDAMTFKLSRKPSDAAQAVYEALEADPSGKGSFELKLPGSAGTIYFTAQVSMFAMVDGGSRNTIHTSSVELCIQSEPVFVAAA